MEPFLTISAVVSTLLGSFAGGGISLFMMSILLTGFEGWPYIYVLAGAKVGSTTGTLMSVFIHKKHQNFNVPLVFTLTVSSLIGTGIGTYLMQFVLSKSTMQMMLAAFLVISVIYLACSKKTGITSAFSTPSKKDLVVAFVYGFLLNILNGIFGGTGMFLMLFLVLYFKMDFIQATATSFTSYVTVNIFQTAYLVVTASLLWNHALFIIIGGLLGSFVGTKLQYLKGNVWVKYASLSVMTLLAGKMLYGVL